MKTSAFSENTSSNGEKFAVLCVNLDYFTPDDKLFVGGSRRTRVVDHQGLHHRLWPAPRYQMDGSIVVSGRPYPIRDGRVTNVPAGIGGKRTTIRMLVENKEIVESVAAFQARDYPAAPHPAAHTRASFHV